MPDQRHPDRPPPAEPEGGDPVCWLELVCPECGRLADDRPSVRCRQCGAELPVP
ncbi:MULTISPECIES: hypothetical protein [unclassified Modestobacter]